MLANNLQPYISQSYSETLSDICPPLGAPETVGQKWSNRLPILFNSFFGGCDKQAAQLALAWVSLRHAATILDDIQDGDRSCDDPQTCIELNGSTGLLFGSNVLILGLAELGASSDVVIDLITKFQLVGLRAANGQHLDLSKEHTTLQDAWEIIFRKTADVGALACWAGARLADSADEQLTASWRFGFILGVLEQIKNDFHGLWGGVESDISNAKLSSLPLAYALSVLPQAERTVLTQQVFDSAETPALRHAARITVIESGAAAYLVEQTNNFHQQGVDLVKSMMLSDENTELLLHILALTKLSPPSNL